MKSSQKLPHPLSAVEPTSGVETRRKSREPLYGEPKKPTIFALTPTASSKLDLLAAEFALSRSELIEQIARGIIPIGSYSDSSSDKSLL